MPTEIKKKEEPDAFSKDWVTEYRSMDMDKIMNTFVNSLSDFSTHRYDYYINPKTQEVMFELFGYKK